jgi:hypothetical protein
MLLPSSLNKRDDSDSRRVVSTVVSLTRVLKPDYGFPLAIFTHMSGPYPACVETAQIERLVEEYPLSVV